MSSPLKLLMKRRSQNRSFGDGKQSPTKFDPKKYSVQFDALLQVDDAREHFFSYLINVSDCQEIVVFLKDFEQYKHEYKLKTIRKKALFKTEKMEASLQTNINYLYNNFRAFFKKHLESFTLNLSSTLIQKAKEMNEELENLMKSKLSRVSSLPSLKESRSSSNTTTNRILQLLNPEFTFEGIRLSILHDMMQDQFPRYLTSNDLQELLTEQGEEFTRRIAISNEKGRIDFRMKSNDFVGDEITPRYIYGAFSLSEASDCWELVHESQEPSVLSTYLSNTDFSIGKRETTGLKCYKHVFNLDMERDFIFALYASSESRCKLDIEEKSHLLGFKSGTQNKTLSCTKSKTILSFDYAGIKMKDRALYTTNATVYDAELDCIITIHKSYGDNNNELEQSENEVRADALVVRFFYRLGPHSTRLIVIVFSDMKFPLQTSMFSTMMIKRRAKALRTSLLDAAPLFYEKWLDYRSRQYLVNQHDDGNDENNYPPSQPQQQQQQEEEDCMLNVDKMFRISNDDEFLAYRCLKENIQTFGSCEWYKAYREQKGS
ncbi:predicted protein [Naegleria gruberi]|uniref:Predicted protein n=1 Tax=Naegleria gruberi TaxID=5762 RepID=D2V8H3_NAEGR|nr:uncharacterized protein NAEGRDRAFT_47519 [Naegleria gruberi]EFC46809.1 predicted protein [Naegleria gruberi]|eukprot:XP_002679553.1 predicted protein [Naegleria gruberi strain NEG-M]